LKPSKFINYSGPSFASIFQDLQLKFPGLSRAWKNPGKNSGLCRMHTNPDMRAEPITSHTLSKLAGSEQTL